MNAFIRHINGVIRLINGTTLVIDGTTQLVDRIIRVSTLRNNAMQQKRKGEVTTGAAARKTTYILYIYTHVNILRAQNKFFAQCADTELELQATMNILNAKMLDAASPAFPKGCRKAKRNCAFSVTMAQVVRDYDGESGVLDDLSYNIHGTSAVAGEKKAGTQGSKPGQGS